MTQHRTEAVKADLIWALHTEARRLIVGVTTLSRVLVQSGNGHLLAEALKPLEGME